MKKKITIKRGTTFYVKLDNPFDRDTPLRVICRVTKVVRPGEAMKEEAVQYQGLFLKPHLRRTFPRDQFGFWNWLMPLRGVMNYDIVDESFFEKGLKMFYLLQAAIYGKKTDPKYKAMIEERVKTYREGMSELMEKIEAWIEENKQM